MPDARSAKANPTAIALLVLGAIGAGALAFVGSTALYVVYVLGDPLSYAMPYYFAAAFIGAFLGLGSCIYILPFLWRTRIWLSSLLVFGTSVPLAIIVGGITHPFAGLFAGAFVQFISAAASFFCFSKPSRRQITIRCQHCGYNCTGIRSNTCPECGNPAPNLDDLTQGHCQACRVGKLRPNGTCETCGTLDFNRSTQ